MSALGDDIARQVEPSGAKRAALGKIAELLERNGIDIDEVGSVRRVSLYQQVTKDPETGEPTIHDLTAVQLSPHWADGPTWPVIQPGAVVKLPAPKASRTPHDGQVAVILPDIQIGYFRGADGDLIPTHDESALSAALAVTAAAKPDLVVLVGDNLDLPEMSKYRLTAPYQRTTQATIDRAALLCAQVRYAAPDARIVWIAGNHEERLPRYLIDNANAAFGLRQGNSPESWPVMSVPYLCRLDEYGVEYLSGYPTGCVWITPKLRVIHGDRVASGGSTAHKYLATEKVSVVYGHIHRIEMAYRTREDFDGPSTVMAASPGCLARIDGVVPSTRGGTDLDGRPLTRHEDWQQGLAVVPYDSATGRFTYEHIPIFDGEAFWRGKRYSGG